ncbi:MAG: hypothetical protein RLZZ227_2017 [Pseudomonadota bacterium]|jgi:hypothetical protein
MLRCAFERIAASINIGKHMIKGIVNGAVLGIGLATLAGRRQPAYR